MMWLPIVIASQQTLPFVHPMFSDNMVIQRDVRAPIWGWDLPGTLVKVQVGGGTYSARTGPDGRWQTSIGPLKLGDPYEIKVDGTKSVSFKNVLAGDVWICSGQSNMEMGVGVVKDSAAEIAAANFPNIRLYMVPRIVSATPLVQSPSDWKVCTPETLAKTGVWGGFSASGYFFGRQLHQDTKVPIGLIHTSWGGTIAEAWARKSNLLNKLPEFTAATAAVEATATGATVKMADWYAANDAGTKGGWQLATAADEDWSTISLPKLVQESGLSGFTARQSVIWFRKTIEVSDDTAAKALTLRLMVDDDDMTWVNGVKVGATEGYNVQRAYKLPAGLIKPGKNVIAVRVTDSQSPGGIYGDPNTLTLEVAGGAPISLVGDWKVKLGGAVTDKTPFPISLNGNPNLPTVLYNGMIAPIVPFAVKGAIWYQGESNAGRGYQYRTLLPTMIQSWRDAFNCGPFPFLIVQLAGFMRPPAEPGDDDWAELREAQFLTTKALPNVGIMSAIDIGEMNDIHPKNKQEVGRRLALVAESKFYGLKVTSSGPTYRSMRIDGSSIRLDFDHADSGLTGGLDGFAIAGEERKWHWATAKLEGKTVVVSSPEVTKPVAVRYGWSAFTKGSLANAEGLPLFPFRTDNWKLKSQK